MRPRPSEPIVAELRRRGLAAPAWLLMEAHRPLRPLLSDIATFLSPVGGPLLGNRLTSLEAVLEDEAEYDRLASELGEPDPSDEVPDA